MILDPRHYRLDDLLRRPYTPTTPFGATGDCLWATSPQGWGFREGVHWVHKTGERGLGPIHLDLRVGGDVVEPEDTLYRPSHVTLNARHPASGLQITEDKFLTRDDVVVSVLSVRNPGEETVALEIELAWGVANGEQEFRKGTLVYVRRDGPPGDDLRQRLPSGARRTYVFAVAFAPDEEEARRRSDRWRDPELGNPVRRQAEEYQEWFDGNVPRFDCSDPWLTKLWYHRWYLIRKNHFNPRAGLVREDSFSEGRWNSDWYSATITYGAGHVLRELRWLRDPRYARNYFRGFARNQRSDGLYRSFYLDGIARPSADEGKYTDWITAAVWDVHLIHPHTGFLREALPTLEKNVAFWQSHSWDGDGLLVVDDHWWTGMEWQPSFFYRANYVLGERRDGRDVQNPVKRLDLTSYQYANVRALQAVQQALGDTNAAQDSDWLARSIRDAVQTKMWHSGDGFFYDLLTETDEPIRSARTIAAFYPFHAGLAGKNHLAAWSALFDPTQFRTTFPPASTSQRSPAYSQEPQMKGHPLTVCYWNGPTWPHSISLTLSGLARSLREHGEENHPAPARRKGLFGYLHSFARAQFEEGDFARPHTGEFYDGNDGHWRTQERDYLHSTWADLIVTGIIGLVPREDNILEIHPLLPSIADGGWAHFCLENVPYHHLRLTLVWDDPHFPEDAYADGDKGFTVYVDGRRFYHQEDLQPFTVLLPKG